MHPVRKQRLLIVLFIVVLSSTAVLLMGYVLRDNINLFYPPGKIVAGEAPINTQIRGGGCVVPGSIVHSQTDLRVDFRITDGVFEVPVTYTGILPDLFTEGEATVVKGRVNASGLFEATEVLAKHDENYTPAEVADTIVSADAKGITHQASCDSL